MGELKVGMKAPEFLLKGPNAKEYSLSQFKGKKVVLYFYPQDDTETCTEQACNFRDRYSEISAKGAVLIGVSPDNEISHGKFSSKYHLPFLLLSDEGKKMMRSYGVWKQKIMFGRKYLGVVRTTFIIDENGVISRIFPRVRLKGHIDKVLEAIS